ncbi:MAG: heme-binding domain-containing protein [Limisphaerales bacterium]
MRNWPKRIGVLAVVAVIALQLTNPPRQSPPVLQRHDVLATNAPPPAVAALLKNSCYDCHSFETKWPWYSRIAPVSWYVARDVNAARASLNFSEWPHDDDRRARKRWRRIADEVQNGEMPPPSYSWMHRQARLDARQRAELAGWAEKAGGQ